MTEVLSKGQTYRVCVVCDAPYASGTYKQHQTDPGHAEKAKERARQQNVERQRNWRARNAQRRHLG